MATPETMEASMVRKVSSGGEAAAIETIVLAFSEDPVARWVFPEKHDYLTSFPKFAWAFGGAAFPNNSAYCTEDLGGAALWLPPNVEFDEDAIISLMGTATPESIRGDVFAVFDQMNQYHPTEPHWYLSLIGVDPAHQRKGYGGALMKRALEQCDRAHMAAYLESTNPRNVSLYQRHGFEALGTIQKGSSPPLIPMLRKAR
jgi:ribosomal protein S18 acetylase RimI-like enzyme